MSIRNSRLIFPLLAFLCFGPALSAKAETNLTEDAPLSSEQSVIKQAIQSKIEAIALQTQDIRVKAVETEKLLASLQNTPAEQTNSEESVNITIASNNAISATTPEALSSQQSVAPSVEKLIARLSENAATKAENISSEPVGIQNSDSANIYQSSTTAVTADSQPPISYMEQLIVRLGKKNDVVTTVTAVDANPQPEEQTVAASPVMAEQSTPVVQNELTQAVTANTEAHPQILKQSEFAVQSSATVGSTSVDLQNKSEEQTPALMAQTGSTSSTTNELDDLRQQLRIDPLIEAATRTYPPSLTFGIPSAFGANWGDFFIGASGATAGKARDGQIDGSISTGFGIGDANKLIGMTFTYNIGSIRNFGSNGTFDLQGHRNIYQDATTSVAIAAGWSAFAQYTNNDTPIPSSVWGTVTSYSLLQPDNPINQLPLLLSVGVGGGYYRQDPASTGVFGGVGLQVAPQLGVGLQWSGVGLNLGLSFVPVPTIPLTVVATGADLTDNSPGGTRFILSVNYGFNFLPPVQ